MAQTENSTQTAAVDVTEAAQQTQTETTTETTANETRTQGAF